MPLKFSEELDLPHALARPIEPRQRDQFMREAAAALEAMAEKTGTSPGPDRLHRIAPKLLYLEGFGRHCL